MAQSEMVERVAKVLWGNAANRRAADWDKFDERAKELWREDARRAIEAMEEPTEDMIERGQGCLDCVPINRCEQQAKQVWAGMIWVAAHGLDE